MLDLSHEQSLMAVAWEKVELKPRLPKEMTDFFDQHGTLQARPGCRRAYLRFYLRSQAILQRGEMYMGVYTADASRQGLCFLSPVQLLPKERCRIRLPKTKDFQIEVVRCRRLGEACYECGVVFVLGAYIPNIN
jgi:PilZ domain-containing protein